MLCRTDAHLCAIPLEHVIETMRVLPIEPVPGAPPFVTGLCVVRGAAVPVVDTGLLMGQAETAQGMLVAVRVEGRTVALRVAAVVGVRAMQAAPLAELPPLLQRAAGDAVSAIGTLDAQLLFVLNSVRILPDTMARELASGTAA